MTDAQRKVYDFVCRQVREWRRGPTYREIQEALGYASPNAALSHVTALRRAGLLLPRRPGSRAILPTSLSEVVPVFGTIPAGIPVDAIADSDESLQVSGKVFGVREGTKLFGLRVRGDSMIGAGICDGDVVILTDRPPIDGEIVAALVDNESTLKRFMSRNGRVLLKAENPARKDIRPTGELVIQGVMVGLIRAASR